MESRRGSDARHLSNAVRHLPGDKISVEGAGTDELRAPEAAQLSQLLIQRHE